MQSQLLNAVIELKKTNKWLHTSNACLDCAFDMRNRLAAVSQLEHSQLCCCQHEQHMEGCGGGGQWRTLSKALLRPLVIAEEAEQVPALGGQK